MFISTRLFQAGRSAVSNLLECSTDWLLEIDSGNFLDIVYLDLYKAFESVVYSKLIYKLDWFGITDNLLV